MNNEKKTYPDISPILRFIGALWAMGLVTYLIITEKEVNLFLWLIAASAGLGTLFLPVMDYVMGERLKKYDHPVETEKPHDSEH